ncbi:MAG: hypothetical protein E7L17_12950 [Clostridium sp.]|uniref:hypothetical protein n=1 Tax=Clostridium sp. TaxID=1506 RepID=UPI00290E625D|nr:hypothetical protein [Clostridium sp.]MDU7339009.1 hypothetical protein [Clostridium sp.]
MPTEIIVALLSFAGTLIGALAGILIANKLVNYRIAQLEKKVDTHNQVIDRTYKLEKETALIEQEQSEIKNDIKEIKNAIKERTA